MIWPTCWTTAKETNVTQLSATALHTPPRKAAGLFTGRPFPTGRFPECWRPSKSFYHQPPGHSEIALDHSNPFPNGAPTCCVSWPHKPRPAEQLLIPSAYSSGGRMFSLPRLSRLIDQFPSGKAKHFKWSSSRGYIFLYWCSVSKLQSTAYNYGKL